MAVQQIGNNRCFGGQQLRYSHHSDVLKCEMTFSIYLPPQAHNGEKVPVLYWLSGLTCTDENFVTKAGAQQYAAKYGVAIVAPDTSPRGDSVPDDPEGAFDFGLGAGFYVNATQQPWATHYRMYDYIVKELPELVNSHFSVDGNRVGIFGHSMGGARCADHRSEKCRKIPRCQRLLPHLFTHPLPLGAKGAGQLSGE